MQQKGEGLATPLPTQWGVCGVRKNGSQNTQEAMASGAIRNERNTLPAHIGAELPEGKDFGEKGDFFIKME